MSLLAIIRARQGEELRREVEAPRPADLCLACGTSAWFWCAGWPVPGEGRWLCRTCSSRPVPSLHDVAAGLTADQRRELEAEEAAGDVLARLVLDTLAETAPPAAVAAVEDIAATLTRALSPDGPGWVVVWSGVLGEEVVFTRDGEMRVPAEYASLPQFTREELAVLAEQRPDADRLRVICDVKREFGGRVVRDTGEPLVPARGE